MNKVDIEIKYGYYTDKEFEDNPLFAISKFNVNTILLLLERMIKTTYTKGKREFQFFNKSKGKTEGKQYFSNLKIIRGGIHYKSLSKSSDRWFVELCVWNNYDDFKEGLLKNTILYKGYIEWNLIDLFRRICSICEEWDKEVFNNVMIENLKPLFNQHSILSWKEFEYKITKTDEELYEFEGNIRKREREETERVCKIFDEVNKE